jgi:hypothetical protein
VFGWLSNGGAERGAWLAQVSPLAPPAGNQPSS